MKCLFDCKDKIFYAFSQKSSCFFWWIAKKALPLHPQNKKRRFANTLGYGVMVTLQILVLPFLVRVRVPQQDSPLSH